MKPAGFKNIKWELICKKWSLLWYIPLWLWVLWESMGGHVVKTGVLYRSSSWDYWKRKSIGHSPYSLGRLMHKHVPALGTYQTLLVSTLYLLKPIIATATVIVSSFLCALSTFLWSQILPKKVLKEQALNQGPVCRELILATTSPRRASLHDRAAKYQISSPD